jgi:hypothetical protein
MYLPSSQTAVAVAAVLDAARILGVPHDSVEATQP